MSKSKKYTYKFEKKGREGVTGRIIKSGITAEFSIQDLHNSIEKFQKQALEIASKNQFNKITIEKITEQIPSLRKIKRDLIPVYHEYCTAVVEDFNNKQMIKDLENEVVFYQEEIKTIAECLNLNEDELMPKPRKRSAAKMPNISSK